MMGKTIGVIPEKGEVIAPVSGVVTVAAETKHAVGITTDSGAETLIHVGMDTVNLKGEGFKMRVKQGDRVNRGELLIKFKLNELKEKGVEMTSAFLSVYLCLYSYIVHVYEIVCPPRSLSGNILCYNKYNKKKEVLKMKYAKWSLVLAVLCGCASASPADTSTAQHSANNEETTPAQQENEQKAPDSFWIIPPSMELDRVYELEAWPFILGADVELSGPPQQWDNNTTEHDPSYPDEPYTANSITAVHDGQYAILDYEGNILSPFAVIPSHVSYEDGSAPVVYHPISGFLVYADYDFGHVFSADFRSQMYGRAGGIGGDAPSPYLQDGKLYIHDPQTNTEVPYTNQRDCRELVLIRNDAGEWIGSAGVDTDSSILFEIPSFASLCVNGYLSVADQLWWDNPQKYGFVRMDDGSTVTDMIFDEVKYYEDGFAPVRQGDAWAYIDTDGKQVTDFLFEDASVVYDGKAYVRVNGRYGILDLNALKTAGHMLSSEDCQGDWETITYDTDASASSKPIGKVTVNVDSLNSRSIPGTYGDKKGKVDNGSTYDVYDVYTDEEYTWYRIAEDRWIASKDDWCTYIPAN